MSAVQTKACQNCKADFVIEPDDFAFYEKIKVPPPTWCWRCRAMRRMAFRNMTRLYPRTCAATGKKIFTLLPPDAPMPAYDYSYWISDAWDPMEYGRDYDFSRPFFEQFRDLYHSVPWANVHALDSVNSEYSSAIFSKNCYLCFDSGLAEDSAYSVTLQRSKQCFDIINCKYSELCYFTINTSRSNRVLFSRNCTSCSDVWFSDDCVGCSDCFGCIGLRNKKYHIFNRPYSKKEYGKMISDMRLGSWSGIQKARQEVERFWLTQPFKYQHGVQANGSTGDYLFNVSQLRNCFFSDTAQNCAHCQSIIYNPIKDCMDVTSSGLTIELCYETVCSGENLSNVAFTFDTSSATNARYVTNCRQVNNAFGCVGVRGRDYCILNKQYSKEEYQALVPRIIQHMDDMPYIDPKGRAYRYGEFLPPEMSPFGFNATQGQEYFPLTKEEAGAEGFRWQDAQEKTYAVTVKPGALPDAITEAKDEILKEVIQCAHDESGEHLYDCASNCATAFKLIPEEVQFYRRMGVPLPHLCFYCRHFQLVAARNKPQLYPGKCKCAGVGSDNRVYQNTTTHFHGGTACPNTFQTTYAPERPEIVYCEQCYQAEVA